MSGDMVYCRDCGAEIAARAEICPECGIRQQPPESDNNGADSDAGIAAVASFILPGLGQIYNGEIAKGLLLMVFVLGTAITLIGLVIAVPLWIWAIYDAYTTAAPGSESVSVSRSVSNPGDTFGGGDHVGTINSAVLKALDWYADHGGDASQIADVRQRYRQVDEVAELSNSDLDILINTIDAYEAKHRTDDRLTEARNAFVAHRY